MGIGWNKCHEGSEHPDILTSLSDGHIDLGCHNYLEKAWSESDDLVDLKAKHCFENESLERIIRGDRSSFGKIQSVRETKMCPTKTRSMCFWPTTGKKPFGSLWGLKFRSHRRHVEFGDGTSSRLNYCRDLGAIEAREESESARVPTSLEQSHMSARLCLSHVCLVHRDFRPHTYHTWASCSSACFCWAGSIVARSRSVNFRGSMIPIVQAAVFETREFFIKCPSEFDPAHSLLAAQCSLLPGHVIHQQHGGPPDQRRKERLDGS